MSFVEHLYTSECPKSQSAEYSSHGLKSLTPGDKLYILAKIQINRPIGNAILEAKIQLNTTSRAYLVYSMQEYLYINKAVDRELGALLADNAVREVCDTCICPKCYGKGVVLYKKESRLIECKKCSGVGRIVYKSKDLHKNINKQLSDKLTFEQFNSKYYDKYMDAVDQLHVAESAAKTFAHEVMNRLSGELAA